jgi:hypothetical protein
MVTKTHGTGFSTTRIPDYFFDISSPLRWTDSYSWSDVTGTEEERMVLTPAELADRARRNQTYTKWLNRHKIRSKPFKFQRVRVIRDQYKLTSGRDWWPAFHAAIFTVFMMPENFRQGKDLIQFYVLCPEDCYLLSRFEYEKFDASLPPRSFIENRYAVKDPKYPEKATNLYVLPTRCAHHLKNETAAGKLEYGEHL